jgi:hypothetical protein
MCSVIAQEQEIQPANTSLSLPVITSVNIDVHMEEQQYAVAVIEDGEVTALIKKEWLTFEDMMASVKSFCLSRGWNIKHKSTASGPAPDTYKGAKSSSFSTDQSSSSVSCITECIPSSVTSCISSSVNPCIIHSLTPCITSRINDISGGLASSAGSTSSDGPIPPRSSSTSPDGTSRTSASTKAEHIYTQGYFYCEFYDPHRKVGAPIKQRVAKSVHDRTQHNVREWQKHATHKICNWKVLYSFLKTTGVYHLSKSANLLMDHDGHTLRDTNTGNDVLNKMDQIPEEVYAKIGEWVLEQYTRRQIKKVSVLCHTS